MLRALARTHSCTLRQHAARFVVPARSTATASGHSDEDGQRSHLSKGVSGRQLYPTLEVCAQQPRHARELSNDMLLLLAAHGDGSARRERMVREVMLVDLVDWHDARTRVDEMTVQVSKDHHSRLVSQAAGMCAILLGLGSVPMVFHHDTALWFDKAYVTADVPAPKDLETWLEVGMWTWGWMEPPIGTLSFVFVCLQFARGRGVTNPMEYWARSRKERLLLERYQQYSPMIVLQWAESMTEGQDYTERAGRWES